MPAKYIFRAFSKTVILVFLIVYGNWCHAGKDKTEYSFVNLNWELAENANAIIRNKTGRLEVVDAGRANFTCRFAITVLNQNGKESGKLRLHYDLFSKIETLKAKLYDGYGNFIRETKKKEIEDFALSAGSPGYSDNRFKVLELVYDQFPYTVEFEFSYRIKGLIDYPDWYFVSGQKTAVEESTFVIEVPDNFSIDYHLTNLQIKPDIFSRGNKTIYQWKATDLMPFEYEEFQPPKRNILPILYSRPDVFRMGKYNGSAESWESFGHFFTLLNNKRDLLDEEYAAEIKSLIKELGTDRQKVELDN